MTEGTQLTTLFFHTEVLVLFLILSAVYLLLKFAIKRNKYSKLIPTKKLCFIDIFGDFSYAPSENYYNSSGITKTTAWLQYLCGYVHLFKNEALFSFWIGYTPFIFLNKPEAVEEVLSGKNVNEKAWCYSFVHCWLGTGLVTSHGQKWKSRRKLLSPAFHFDILKEFFPVFNEKSMILTRLLEEETTKDFTSIVQPIILCSLDIVVQTTLGVDIDCQRKADSQYVNATKNASDSIIKRIEHFLCWFDFTFFLTYGRGFKMLLKIMQDFTISVIREKKKKMLSYKKNGHPKKRKALLDLLLEHHIETKEISEDDIREEVDTFTLAGHNTTSMALSWTLYLIGLYKDVQRKLHEEIDEIFGDDKKREVTTEDLRDLKYLECVVKESQRLYPTVPMIARKAGRNLEIGGYPIPENASIVIMPYMIHRREDIYLNPEVFDPNRFRPENSLNRHPYANIPFSAGPRNCIGERFALMAVKVVLVNILRNYILESLDQRDKVLAKMEITLKPMKDLRIKIRPRLRKKEPDNC